MSFFQNTCKPKGLGGRFMVASMNIGHAAMADWGFQHLQVRPTDRCLDVGCGGGANIKRLLTMVPQGEVKGLDYSSVSVEKSSNMNAKAIKEGRCAILKGDVMNMLFAKEYFQVVTAFETVYFWPDILHAFREIYRVMAPGGTFMICNEADGKNPKDDKWVEKIDGMRVYNESQLKSALKQVGFSEVNTETNEKHWLVALAKK